MARRRSCLTLNIRRLILTVTLWIIAICLPYAMENIRKTKKASARDGHRAPHRKEDEESSGPKVTCDTLRGNSKLTVDPRRKDHIDSLSYGKFDATLSSSIPEVNDDINVRLNLNYHWLKEERAMALVGLYQWFEKMRRSGISHASAGRDCRNFNKARTASCSRSRPC